MHTHKHPLVCPSGLYSIRAPRWMYPIIPARVPCADMEDKGHPLLSFCVSYILPQSATTWVFFVHLKSWYCFDSIPSSLSESLGFLCCPFVFLIIVSQETLAACAGIIRTLMPSTCALFSSASAHKCFHLFFLCAMYYNSPVHQYFKRNSVINCSRHGVQFWTDKPWEKD